MIVGKLNVLVSMYFIADAVMTVARYLLTKFYVTKFFVSSSILGAGEADGRGFR